MTALLYGVAVFCALAAVAFPFTWSPRTIRTFTYADGFDAPLALDDPTLQAPDAPIDTLTFNPIIQTDDNAPRPQPQRAETPSAEPTIADDLPPSFVARMLRAVQDSVRRRPQPQSLSIEEPETRAEPLAPDVADLGVLLKVTFNGEATASTSNERTNGRADMPITAAPESADALILHPPHIAAAAPLEPDAEKAPQPQIDSAHVNATDRTTIGTGASAVDAIGAATTVRPHAEPPLPREDDAFSLDSPANRASETDTMQRPSPLASVRSLFSRLRALVIGARTAAPPDTTDTSAASDTLAHEPRPPLGVDLTLTSGARDHSAEADAGAHAQLAATNATEDEVPLDHVARLAGYLARNRDRARSAVQTTSERFTEPPAPFAAYAWVRDAMHADEDVALDLTKRRRLLNLYGNVNSEANVTMLRRIAGEDPELAPDAERLLASIERTA